MAVTSLSEWSTTAGSNTELNSISLAENVMRPPAVNNAFREMMAQLAAYTRRGADLATAGTLNLDSVDTDFLDLTGTTTVTAVTLTDTHSRRARAVGAFQLTASASLIVNGSASTNYTTTAGDLLFFEGYSAGVVRVWTVAGGAGTTFATNAQAITGASTVLSVNPANLAFATDGYTTVATAAGTTTLTAESSPHQYFTGATTQTIVLPVTSTLNLGRTFRIVNNSTGILTVQSSGANTIVTVGPGTTVLFTCILTSGTSAASWDFDWANIITPWVSYTPTFTAFGTVASISMWSRRVGDTLEVQGRFTSGTVVASELRMTLGFNGVNGGITSDATKISATTVLGSWAQAGAFAEGTTLVESGSAYATFGDAANPATKTTGSSAANTTVQHVKFAVPITGW
jgi:hypothetical protein